MAPTPPPPARVLTPEQPVSPPGALQADQQRLPPLKSHWSALLLPSVFPHAPSVRVIQRLSQRSCAWGSRPGGLYAAMGEHEPDLFLQGLLYTPSFPWNSPRSLTLLPLPLDRVSRPILRRRPPLFHGISPFFTQVPAPGWLIAPRFVLHFCST